ncbi:MAG: TonB family protein [Pyrinomonadaceae bacterium]
MFEQLIETEPKIANVKGRKSYFIISTIALCSILFTALIVSLFAVDLNLGMGELDMVELIAPVDVTDQKLPEPEIAPKVQAKPQGGPSQTASRRINMARIDEAPREVPATVSTTTNTTKERPLVGKFDIGKFDTGVAGGSGSGRGDGTGPGDGLGLATDDQMVASTDDTDELPPPPPVKAVSPVKEKPLIKSMGVVNSIAISLPLPAVSAAARRANAMGTVSVQVVVDENGHVISANAVSGNILLREASEAAARSARFSPATISGTPVKISGVIHYRFSTDS